MSGGGGTSTATTTSDIDPDFRPARNNLFNTAVELSTLGPDAYKYQVQGADGSMLTGGDARVANFSGDQANAFAGVRARQGHLTPLYEAAAGATYDIGAGQTFDNLQAGQEVTRGIATGQQRLDDQAFLQGVNDQSLKEGTRADMFAGAYVNPYTDMVVNSTIDDMNRASALASENARLSAAGRGAFGSQNDLAQTEIQRNLVDRVGAVGGQLRQSGFNTAMGLGADDANRQQRTNEVGSQQRISGLQNAAAMQADNLNRQLTASQQLGQMDLGMANARLQASNALAGQAAARQNYELTDANALAAQGAQQQALMQAKMDADYADHVQDSNHAHNQVAFLANALNGIPIGTQGTVPVQKPDRFGQILGAAGNIGAAYAGACWVAREAYGMNNPRWIDFRAWLLNSAPGWFRELYIAKGERFAAWIKDKPIIKGLVRMGMEIILRSAGK